MVRLGERAVARACRGCPLVPKADQLVRGSAGVRLQPVVIALQLGEVNEEARGSLQSGQGEYAIEVFLSLQRIPRFRR
jgi:hypothetical protein